MSNGVPDFEGDKKAVTQHDPKEELYRKECDELCRLIGLHGWPKGWPKEGQILAHKGSPYRKRLITYQYQDDQKENWVSGQYGGDWLSNDCVPLPCGETVMMLINWLGKRLAHICFFTDGGITVSTWKSEKWASEGFSGFGHNSLIFALCAAVRAKIEVERGPRK